MRTLKRTVVIGLVCFLGTATIASAGMNLNFFSDKKNATSPTQTHENQDFTPAQTKQIEKIVREYLVNNPKVIVDVFGALRAQEAAKKKAHLTQSISEHATQLFHAPLSPVLGNAQGDVSLVEFLDYRCQHCKEMGETIAQLIKSDPNLRLVIKQLPIFGGESEYAAKAALASQKQGKFQAFHEALLKAKMPINETTVTQIAKQQKLNIKQLRQDMQSAEINQQMKDNVALAEALSIAGTPTFIVADSAVKHAHYMMGAVEVTTLKKAIATARGQEGQSNKDTQTMAE